MTKTLFLEDCYLKELDAVIVCSEECKVELDKSIFCYQGGGQLADNGILTCNGEEYRVVDVRKENGRLMHHLNREGLKKGDSVHCKLDWKRRYALMKGHTAMHVLAAIVHKRTGALISGGQIDIDKCRIDFSLDEFDREKVAEYVAEANEAAKSNQPVKMRLMKREEALKIPGMVKLANAVPPQVEMLRIVEIGDIDTQADGGTHVANTSEIGKIELIKVENKGKNNRRIHFKLS